MTDHSKATDQSAAAAIAACRFGRPTEDADKHRIGEHDGFVCFKSVVTRCVYAAHADSGRFFRSTSDGSSRMRGWSLRETIEEDRSWLRPAFQRLGWTIGSNGELAPPPRPVAVTGPTAPMGGGARPSIPGPAPVLKRKTSRVTIEEHHVSAPLSAWDVRRALVAIGVSVPDTVAEVRLELVDGGGLEVSWSETHEKHEDIVDGSPKSASAA